MCPLWFNLSVLLRFDIFTHLSFDIHHSDVDLARCGMFYFSDAMSLCLWKEFISMGAFGLCFCVTMSVNFTKNPLSSKFKSCRL